ncbi:unnamed protein product [Brassica oleracea]
MIYTQCDFWRFIYKKTGHSSSTVQVRLLRFWESRTVHHGGERMEVDMLLLDSQVDVHTSKVSRLQLWFRVELPLVSTRLLSSVMGDQTTLGRMSIRLLTTSWSMNWWNPK